MFSPTDTPPACLATFGRQGVEFLRISTDGQQGAVEGVTILLGQNGEKSAVGLRHFCEPHLNRIAFDKLQGADDETRIKVVLVPRASHDFLTIYSERRATEIHQNGQLCGMNLPF